MSHTENLFYENSKFPDANTVAASWQSSVDILLMTFKSLHLIIKISRNKIISKNLLSVGLPGLLKHDVANRNTEHSF